MEYRLLPAVVLVAAGCAQRYATPTELRASATPDAVFSCVKQQFGVLGYKQSSLDADELRISGTKIDETSRRSDTQFRRVLNRLEVDVSPAADGNTDFVVLPRTFAEYTTQRGPTETEEKSSTEVKADAQSLLERCKG